MVVILTVTNSNNENSVYAISPSNTLNRISNILNAKYKGSNSLKIEIINNDKSDPDNYMTINWRKILQEESCHKDILYEYSYNYNGANFQSMQSTINKLFDIDKDKLLCILKDVNFRFSSHSYALNSI